MKRAFYHFSKRLLRSFFEIFFDFRAYGLENVPKSGPVILVANHSSFFDPPVSGCALKRHIHFVARGTLADSALLRFFLWTYEVILVRRGESDAKAMRLASEALREGNALLLFPEGTRSESGEVGSFQEGAVFLARRARAPVIPLGIAGTFEAFPKGRKRPQRSKIRVVYGPPVELDSKSREAATEEIRQRVCALVEEARRKSSV